MRILIIIGWLALVYGQPCKYVQWHSDRMDCHRQDGMIVHFHLDPPRMVDYMRVHSYCQDGINIPRIPEKDMNVHRLLSSRLLNHYPLTPVEDLPEHKEAMRKSMAIHDLAQAMQCDENTSQWREDHVMVE